MKTYVVEWSDHSWGECLAWDATPFSNKDKAIEFAMEKMLVQGYAVRMYVEELP